MNPKKTSKNLANLASKVLQNDNSSKIQKSLAGSVLSQRNTNKQTGSTIEDVASRVLNSDKYSATTKSLAASTLSQSDKNR